MNDHYTMEHGNSHKELKHVKKIFTGHYHMRQNKDNVTYIGSPFQFDYSDANDFVRGFTVLDTENGETEFVKYDKIHILSLDHKDFLNNDMTEIKNKSIRLNITEEIDDDTLELIKKKLEKEIYRDSKIIYSLNKTQETITQETDVQNVESVDDVVKHHLTNMHEVAGVDNQMLLTLYNSVSK